MYFLIMRHGEAKPRVKTDAARPLTDFGQQQVRTTIEQLAPEIRQQVEHVIVSPYLRTQQTWQAIADLFPNIQQMEKSANVIPEGPYTQVADYLEALAHQGISILVVSHLPHVDFLCCELCPSLIPPVFTPASVAIIEKKGEENQFIRLIQG